MKMTLAEFVECFDIQSDFALGIGRETIPDVLSIARGRAEECFNFISLIQPNMRISHKFNRHKLGVEQYVVWKSARFPVYYINYRAIIFLEDNPLENDHEND